MSRLRRSHRLTSGLAAVALLLAGVGAQLVTAPLAQAAGNGQLLSISAIIVGDGTVHQNGGYAAAGPVMVNGVTLDGDNLNGDGLDANHNGVVAVQDVVSYRISVEYAAGVASGDVLSLVGTMPAGVLWQATSYSAANCDAAGTTGYNNTVKFTCKWTSKGETKADFTWYAKPTSSPWYQDQTFSPTFTDGNGGPASFTGPSVKVASAPAVEFKVMNAANPVYQVATYAGPDPAWVGEPGFYVYYVVRVGSWQSDPRGLEALKTPYTVHFAVTDNEVFRATTASAGQQVGGIGNTVDVTVTAAMAYPQPHPYITLQQQEFTVTMFVPYLKLTPGVTTTEKLQVIGFDEPGLSSQSNFGAGVAPGQETTPTPACTNTSASGSNCYTVGVVYYDRAVPDSRMNTAHQIGSTAMTFGTSNYYPYIGSARLVPGEKFVSQYELVNQANASVAMRNTTMCQTWDSSLSTLQGPVGLAGYETATLGLESGWDPSLVGGGNGQVPTADYVLEYAYVPALVGKQTTPTASMPNALSTFPCGKADTGDTTYNGDTIVWSTDPTTDPTNFPDGWASVNAVRVLLKAPLVPSATIGLEVPLQMTSDVLPTGTQVHAYVQQNSDDQASVRTNDNWAIANPALLRAATSVYAIDAAGNTLSTIAPGGLNSATTAAGGNSATFQLLPTVIGPADDVNSTAVNGVFTLTFDSACVDASGTSAALLSQLAAAGYANATVTVDLRDSATAAACDGGSKNGPVITIKLVDDVPAPGSSSPAWITANNVGGNETYVFGPSGLSVPVVFSPLTPQGTVLHMTTEVTSDTDTGLRLYNGGNMSLNTPASATYDRLSWAIVTVNTPAKFTARKWAVTAVPGWVAPGESFVYDLLLSNTMDGDFGISTFVDVLPFPGDPRVAAVAKPDALAGTLGLKVTAASGSMTDYVAGVTTPLRVYCTASPAMSVYTALASDPTGGGSPTGGPFNWTDCSSSVPANTTAVKFVTPSNLVKAAVATASITVTAPCMAIGGHIVNDMAYYAPPALNSPLLLQKGISPANSDLASSSAALSGTVYRDLNFSGTFDVRPGDAVPPDGYWPAGATVGLYEVDGTTPVDCPCTGQAYTATVGANGAYSFPIIPPGTYTVALTSVPTAPTWKLIATDTTSDSAPLTRGPAVWSADATIVNPVVVLPATTRAVDNLLYQALYAPAIALKITGALPVGSTGVLGDTITWTYTITNKGDAPLTNLTINDAGALGLAASITCGGTALADMTLPVVDPAVPGSGTLVCTAPYTPVTQADLDWGQVIEKGTVSGVDPVATTATSVEATGSVILAQDPGGPIVKSALLVDTNGNGKGDAGEQVSFIIDFLNDGNVTLSLLDFTDSMPDLTLTCLDQNGLPVTNGDITLAPTQWVECTTNSHTITTAEVAAGGVTNTATVSGQAGTVDPTTRQGKAGGVSGSSTVTVPAVSVAAGGAVPPGATGGMLAGAGLMVLGGWLLVRRLVGGREAGETV